MKSLTTKLFAIMATTLALPTLSYADYIGVKYYDGKDSDCKVTYRYYDGKTRSTTCTVYDTSSRSPSNNYIHLQCGGGEIRHLGHNSSAILIQASGNCSADEIASVRAAKTAGSDKMLTASAFSSKNISNTYLKSRVNSTSLCYQQMDLDQMRGNLNFFKVALNKQDSWDNASGGSQTRCKQVTLTTDSGDEVAGAYAINDSQAVAIKTHHNTYVVTEGGGGGDVNANRTSIGEWETITMHTLETEGTSAATVLNMLGADALVLFQAHYGQYICPDNGGGADVHAVKSTHDESCYFFMFSHADGKKSFMRGGYFLVAEGDGDLLANRSAIGDWEKFTLIPQ